MAALGDFVEVDELGIRLLRPAPRRLVQLVREDAHGHRDVDALGRHVTERVLPVEATRRDARVRQPEVRAVVEDIVARQALWYAVEGPRNQLEAARVMVEQPGGQANG